MQTLAITLNLFNHDDAKDVEIECRREATIYEILCIASELLDITYDAISSYVIRGIIWKVEC